MINPKILFGKLFFKLGLYWFLSMTTAAFVVSLISFLRPFENMDEYKTMDIILYESRFMFRTFYAVLFISYFVGAIGFTFNYAIYRTMLPKLKLKKLIIIVFNLLLFLSIPLIWKYIGYEVNSDFYLYVLPAYAVSLILFGWKLIPTPQKDFSLA